MAQVATVYSIAPFPRTPADILHSMRNADEGPLALVELEHPIQLGGIYPAAGQSGADDVGLGADPT